VGVSDSVVGVVVPLGDGLAPRPDAPQEAAAFLQQAPDEMIGHKNGEAPEAAPPRQVRILWTPEHRFVLDNRNALPGSGTFVNGLHVQEERSLSPGDEIEINGVRFRFEV
jgi:hypothetical protein